MPSFIYFMLSASNYFNPKALRIGYIQGVSRLAKERDSHICLVFIFDLIEEYEMGKCASLLVFMLRLTQNNRTEIERKIYRT